MSQKRKQVSDVGAAAKRTKLTTESSRLGDETKSPKKNQLLKFGGTQEPDVGDAFINPDALSYFREVKVSFPLPLIVSL